MAAIEPISLLELNSYVKRVLALNFSDAVPVIAEIASAKQSRGHWYLDLIQKDETGTDIVAQSQAVLWQGNYNALRHKLGNLLDDLLQAGLSVQLSVRVDFHERYGLKLTIQDIDPTFTLGKLALEQQETLRRLQAEQLLERNHQWPLPLVMQRLAIVSAKTAAGLADLLHHLEHNQYGYHFELTLFDSAVQGQSAPAEIAASINQISEAVPPYDAVLVVRGGGARLDLRAFDDYEVCRAIANCKIPVIAGIGHETDRVLADLVAARSFKTPTAVGDFIVQHNAKFEFDIQQAGEAIRFLVQQQLETRNQQLSMLSNALKMSVRLKLAKAAQNIENIDRTLQSCTRQAFKQAKQNLDLQAALISQADPVRQLQRGYSMTLKDNEPIKSIEQVKPGDMLETMLADGSLTSVVLGP
jgi:exodeoxyribonuclease VII large subunit